MKKILLILLLIPNFLLAKEQCEDMQQPPQEFMGMELITFKKYDDPKMGVGVTYWIKSKSTLSGFKFDYGHETIDQETLKVFINAAIDEIKIVADQKGTKYAGQYDISKENISPILKNSYVFVTEKGVVDFLSIGTDGSCIYKVRYSEGSQDPKESIKKFVDLARAIEDEMQD